MNLRGMAQGLLGFLPRPKWLSLALRQLGWHKSASQHLQSAPVTRWMSLV